MKIESYEGNEERSILTGLIVSSKFLANINEFKPGPEESQLFKNKWSNLVAEWCFKYFDKYEKAPNASIESQFEKWAQKNKDKDTIQLVQRFLSNISDEYDKHKKKIHVSQLTDMALDYFNRNRLSKIKEQIEQSLDDNDLKLAESSLEAYRKLEITNEGFINPYTDPDVHRRSLASRTKPLLKYPGPLGDFFGDMLSRGNFISFMGPEGGGKSFWLQDLCHMGALQRLNVVFFGIGDMSLDQTLWRYQARLARKPYRKQTYYYPVGWKSKSPDGYVFPRRKKRATKKNLSWKEVEAAREKFHRWHLGSDRDMFKMLCQPELGVADIRNKLRRLEDKEGFKPDIVVVDYADLLEAPPGKLDTLTQIDENWRRMRNIALEHNCLMATATQVKRTGYNKLWMELGDVADQKKKVAHVNGMIGLNFRLPEKEKEITRLNWVKIRESTPRARVQVAGCYAIANPAVLSVAV